MEFCEAMRDILDRGLCSHLIQWPTEYNDLLASPIEKKNNKKLKLNQGVKYLATMLFKEVIRKPVKLMAGLNFPMLFETVNTTELNVLF